MSSANPGYGKIDRQYGKRLATTAAADDGPVWMVNLLSYRPVAAYEPGSEAAGDAISGREADDRYAPMEILRDLGAEVVFVGDVEDQLLGDDTVWERVAVVRYPTRRSFIDMQSRDDFKAKHVHKEAGVASTINLGCVPAPVPALADEPLPEWTEVAHPPTDEDGPVVVLHVIRYADDEGPGGASRAEMDQYEQAAARVAAPHGVRVAGWFDVEGTIVGDGRSWDQVRFNRFPSKAAFMAVVSDPARLEAQRTHRAPAMADTYTMILRPTVDRLGEVDPRGTTA